MILQVDAVYEDGLLRPLSPLNLSAGEKVTLSVITPSHNAHDMIDREFVAYARAHVAGLQHKPTLEEGQRRLSTIKGSLFELSISERGEY